MDEALLALFVNPQLFFRAWAQIFLTGFLLFFLFLFLQAKHLLHYAFFFSLFIALSLIFQLLDFPIFQFLSEKAAILTAGLVLLQLALAPKRDQQTMLSPEVLAEAIASSLPSPSLLVISQRLSLDPYITKITPPQAATQTALIKLLHSACPVVYSRSQKILFQAELKEKGNSTLLDQAIYLTRMVDAHCLATHEKKMVHIYRGNPQILENAHQVVSVLKQIFETKS